MGNILDKLVSNTVRIKFEADKQRAVTKAFNDGFKTGRESMQLQVSETGRTGSFEDTHKFTCPNCWGAVNIPCINFHYPTLNKQVKS